MEIDRKHKSHSFSKQKWKSEEKTKEDNERPS